MKTDSVNNQQSKPKPNKKNTVLNALYGKYKLKSEAANNKQSDTNSGDNEDSNVKYKPLSGHSIHNMKSDSSDKEKQLDLSPVIDNIMLLLKKLQVDLNQQKDIDIYSFYQEAMLNLKYNPVSIAYYFLKQGKQIPQSYIKYILFPFLAMKYISNDALKLKDNIKLIEEEAQKLNIKDYTDFSFENILQLKNNLQLKYVGNKQSEENIANINANNKPKKTDTPLIPTIILDAPKNNDTIIDSDDVEHIQYLVKNKKINKATKYDTINRIKRYFLRNKSDNILAEISFIVGILSFALFATGATLGFGVFAIFALRFILFAVLSIISKIKKYKYQKFLDANLAAGLEILNKNAELSEQDLKLITELRKKQSYLFRTIHSDEIYHLYAEIEKMSEKLSALNTKTTKNSQDQTDIIELEFYLNQKEISIEKYMAIADNIFEFSNKELQYNIKKWNETFIPKLNDVFNKKSKEEKNKIIKKVISQKKVKTKIDCINLFTMENDISTEDKISEHTAQITLDFFIKSAGTVAIGKMQGMAEAVIREVFLSCFTRRTLLGSISTIFESVKSSGLFYHSYYITFFFLVLNIFRIKINDSINNKKLKKILSGEKEKTSFFFGLMNSRDRTNREEISTLTRVQKNKTLDVLKLMQKHNACMKKSLKLIEKNTEVSPEKLLEMLVEFKYLSLQASYQMYANTSEFFQVLSDKMSVVSANIADDIAY